MDNAFLWAAGCGLCTHGILSAPELTGVVALHLERLVQFKRGQIVFCQCEAGEGYRASLNRRRWRLEQAARKEPRWQEYADRLTHPDIEHAEAAIDHYNAQRCLVS